jgi:predicted TIM-barrel fold metal-dependent hydrolase
MLNEYLDRTITCLDDYLESIENYLRKALEFGVICFKDQSAYGRTLEYDLPSRAEAEKVFNRIIYHPRGHVGSEEAKVLDDWLFHHFIRLAEIHDLPVQLHTGHMAGLRNDIVKTNAAGFIPVMELHNRVKFDLFHGNWPYMDEYLFIGKNYPNAYLNLCWVQTIDPHYCVELMKRAVMTIPHCKIMAYGGDARLMEQSIGYLIMARDNVAYALTELIECGWLGMQEAEQLAIDWFYNNPNEFYKLGFSSVSV